MEEENGPARPASPVVQLSRGGLVAACIYMHARLLHAVQWKLNLRVYYTITRNSSATSRIWLGLVPMLSYSFQSMCVGVDWGRI